ncbi:hypothetical protein ABBQ32_008805 [Trebouxia sp. C0010 RCD-2024]
MVVSAQNVEEMDKQKATALVWQAIQGQWMSSCLGVLLELHIPDLLAKENEPIALKDLAEKAGVSEAGLDPFYKVLRVMAQYNLLEEHTGKLFSSNVATGLLVRGKDPSLGHMAAHQINTPKLEAWKVLPEAVKTGQTAFVLAHNGETMYQYGERPENAEFGAEFMQSMTYFTQHSLQGGIQSLRDAYDWKSAKCIMDVGGGRGELLSNCMSWAGPKVKGVLFDRPFVIEGVDLPGMFGAKGIEHAEESVTLVVGDVMQPFPDKVQKADVDTLVMKHFLSAFNDKDAILILKHCSQVLAPQGKILLLQTLVPEAGDRKNNTCSDGVSPGLFSIEILAMCPGGSWKPLSEWEELFTAAKLKLESVKAVGCNMHLMCFVKA